MDSYHIPVLLNEVIAGLEVKLGEKYIDCTLGGGGHTRGILEAGGIVLGIDQDSEAIINSKSEIRNPKLILKQGNFAHLKEIAEVAHLPDGQGFNPVAGILFDLGVSSHQLETDYRGFSFNRDGKLDMRMDQINQKVTAADLINAGSEKELANLFWKYGEERFARQIAKQIVESRKQKAIETTNELAEIILRVRKRSDKDRTHPATRVFQALRIAVNDELAGLEMALPQAVELLKTGGKLAVISFHSLEDRIVKNFMREMGDMGVMRELTKKPIEPMEEEIKNNPRARSGKLRITKKV